MLVENREPREVQSSKVIFQAQELNPLEFKEYYQRKKHSKLLGNHALTKSISEVATLLRQYAPDLLQMYL